MKKLRAVYLLAILFFASLVTQAQEVKTDLICIFTRPHIYIIFDPTENTVNYTDEYTNDVVLTKNGKIIPDIDSFLDPDHYIATPGSKYKVVRDNGTTILDLNFSYKGFDGTSEYSYPFEAIYYDEHGSMYEGGCFTENAPPLIFNDIIKELKN